MPFWTWANVYVQNATPGGQSLGALLKNTSTVLAGWERMTRSATISTASPGYFPVQLGLQPVSAPMVTLWHGAIVRLATPLLPPCTVSCLGVFGLNNIGGVRSAAAAAAAIGVRTIRGQVIWRYTVNEDNPLNDSFTWSAYDSTFEAANSYNMSVLLNVFPLPPSRFANSTRPALPRSSALRWLETFAECAVRRYGQGEGRLLGVSVDNEPDGSLWLQGGTGSYANRLRVIEAASVYDSWLKAVKKGVQSALGTVRAKAIPFGGLSVSGGEWSLQNLTFVKAVAGVAVPADRLTLFTGHPYSCNRKLGCSGDMFTNARQWIFPSDTDGDGTLTQKLDRATAEIIEAAGHHSGDGVSLSVWPSEFGWALERGAAPTSLLALGQAAAVSQGLVLMRALAASPRYGPFYLFAAEEAGFEGRASSGGLASFGLWRTCESVSTASFSFTGGRRYPLPAAAAYATASALLELPTVPSVLDVASTPPSSSLGITWEMFERPSVDSEVSDLRGNRNGTGILAIWLRLATNGVTAPGRWTTGCIEVRGGATMEVQTVYTGLGQELQIASSGSPSAAHPALRLELSPLPSFVLCRSLFEAGEVARMLRACATNLSACKCQDS